MCTRSKSEGSHYGIGNGALVGSGISGRPGGVSSIGKQHYCHVSLLVSPDERPRIRVRHAEGAGTGTEFLAAGAIGSRNTFPSKGASVVVLAVFGDIEEAVNNVF